MNNRIYYVKATSGNFPEAIKQGLMKALAVAFGKNYRNIKIVLSQLSLLDDTPNFISQALDQAFSGRGIPLTNQLKRNRAISFPDFPEAGERTGINILSVRNDFPMQNGETVAMLLWADADSFKTLTAALSFTSIDIIAVVLNEEQSLNEMLGATKAEKYPAGPDPQVITYTDELDDEQRQVLQRMKSINVTSSNTHNPTREQMKSVIDELKQKRLQVSYEQFLGYLVNEVNFPVNEAVALLQWKHAYFSR